MAEGVAKLPSNRAAIYARVSTEDKGQTPDNQLLQLRAWCERMGYRVVREYVEHENGGKSVEYRKQLAAMFAGATRREFDLLLVWSLDRFSREGMAATVAHLQRLASHGVAFRSFTEEHLSTENELVRNILLATLSSLAKLEREKISQRTKAGLERARAKGKILGRPKFSEDDRNKLIAALDTGESWHAVSAKTRIPYSTVKKHARALGYEPRQRLAKPRRPVTGRLGTNGSRLPTLQEALAGRLLVGRMRLGKRARTAQLE
jgi:DNA invertase Pin-like site-specific DNA recombinase